ncbi:MAG: hypothetical protein J5374_05395 [Bacteroidales bacterium]|jgi:DNA-directed RNA polymerase alpha subunit|nr:hypothetical protein [Bacteroidales bacterium]
MKQEATLTSKDRLSMDDFYEISLESLVLPKMDRELFRRFVEENKKPIEALWLRFLAEEASRPKDDWTPVMFTKIEDTPLPNLAKNVLKTHDITMVGHLVQHTPKDLLGFWSLGRCTLHEIMKYLETIGLELASD